MNDWRVPVYTLIAITGIKSFTILLLVARVWRLEFRIHLLEEKRRLEEQRQRSKQIWNELTSFGK